MALAWMPDWLSHAVPQLILRSSLLSSPRHHLASIPTYSLDIPFFYHCETLIAYVPCIYCVGQPFFHYGLQTVLPQPRSISLATIKLKALLISQP